MSFGRRQRVRHFYLYSEMLIVNSSPQPEFSQCRFDGKLLHRGLIAQSVPNIFTKKAKGFFVFWKLICSFCVCPLLAE